MVSERAYSASFYRAKPKLIIQTFHQCSSLVSIKLNPSNFLLWKQQVLPLIKSFGIDHHLIQEKPAEDVIDKDGKKVSNPQFLLWTNNDGLLVSWLLGIIMTEDVLTMIMGCETAKQIWSNLEE